MKKTPKKVLGLVSLGLVAITTAFAASIPSPSAMAVETSSLTDTIKVRVVGSVPNVDILEPNDETVFVYPNIDARISYENVEYIDVTLDYTDGDGATTQYTLSQLFPDYEASESIIPLNLNNPRGLLMFGGKNNLKYGDYILTIVGTGISAFDDSSVSFSYVPITVDVAQTSDEGEVTVTLGDYDPTVVDHLEINIYDEDGKLVKPSPIKLNSPLPVNKVIDFSDYGLESGTYTIKTTAYDDEGNQLYHPFESTLDYTEPEAPYVPETGSLMNSLNITKVDYLATGLIFFFAFAILGLVFTSKKRNYRVARKSTGNKRRK